MRTLNDAFLKDLKEGELAQLTDTVKSDPSLCLELRGHYINVYYRGRNLMRVERTGSGYKTSFRAKSQITLPGERESIDAWLRARPKLKQEIDRKENNERESQQTLLRENNFGKIARSTDYYVCDIEYQSRDPEYRSRRGQFDLIGVSWPSKSVSRKQSNDHRLVFVEMKYGDRALGRNAGVRKHVSDIDHYLSDQTRVYSLKQEMVGVFNQKRSLGLIDCGKDLGTFSDEKPMLLLVFVNHDPESETLRDILMFHPKSDHAELCIATASFMGYGLYDQGIHKIDEWQRRFTDYIHSP